MDRPSSLPYWQVNVPQDQRSEECPDFLKTLSAKDLRIINTPDTEYRVVTWAEVRNIIAQNRLDLFQRVPSELRRYLAYNWKLKQDYGSVMNFVLTQRLRWDVPTQPRGKPFEYDEDIKILWNDWPYGIDSKVVHLVIWTKFSLAEDPTTGDLTQETRAEIDAYVQRVFGTRVPSNHACCNLLAIKSQSLADPRYQIIWFKNWQSLKSVHAVEHFHIMLFDPNAEFISEITHGDVPLFEKV